MGGKFTRLAVTFSAGLGVILSTGLSDAASDVVDPCPLADIPESQQCRALDASIGPALTMSQRQTMATPALTKRERRLHAAAAVCASVHEWSAATNFTERAASLASERALRGDFTAVSPDTYAQCGAAGDRLLFERFMASAITESVTRIAPAATCTARSSAGLRDSSALTPPTTAAKQAQCAWLTEGGARQAKTGLTALEAGDSVAAMSTLSAALGAFNEAHQACQQMDQRTLDQTRRLLAGALTLARGDDAPEAQTLSADLRTIVTPFLTPTPAHANTSAPELCAAA